jgi:hypothetical protein
LNLDKSKNGNNTASSEKIMNYLTSNEKNKTINKESEQSKILSFSEQKFKLEEISFKFKPMNVEDKFNTIES